MANYNSDDACPNSPGLEPVRLKATPSPSPPPFIPQQNPAKPSNGRKTRPSQGDTVLMSFIGPNQPGIARLVGEQTLNSDSGSEADEEDMEDIVNHSPPASSAQTASSPPGFDLVGTAQAMQIADSRGPKDTTSPPRRRSVQSDSEKFVEPPCPRSKSVNAASPNFSSADGSQAYVYRAGSALIQ
jgi:hypothetical protein